MLGTSLAAVILAAGKGTRMQSSLPKVLHPLSGKPLLSYVFRTVFELDPDRVLTVVGYGADKVKEIFQNNPRMQFLEQKLQWGTGHAVMQTREALDNFEGTVLVLCGDMPFIRASTLKSMITEHEKIRPACTLLILKTPQQRDFGRILRNKDGEVYGIVESMDATEKQKTIDEYNTGVYCFDKALLYQAVHQLDNRNAQSEYYLTDTIRYFVERRLAIHSIQTRDDREIFGINSEEELAQAELILAGSSS